MSPDLPARLAARRHELRTREVSAAEMAAARRAWNDTTLMRLFRSLNRLAAVCGSRVHTPLRQPRARGAGRPAARRAVRCRSAGGGDDPGPGGEPAPHNRIAVAA